MGKSTSKMGHGFNSYMVVNNGGFLWLIMVVNDNQYLFVMKMDIYHLVI